MYRFILKLDHHLKTQVFLTLSLLSTWKQAGGCGEASCLLRSGDCPGQGSRAREALAWLLADPPALLAQLPRTQRSGHCMPCGWTRGTLPSTLQLRVLPVHGLLLGGASKQGLDPPPVLGEVGEASRRVRKELKGASWTGVPQAGANAPQ